MAYFSIVSAIFLWVRLSLSGDDSGAVSAEYGLLLTLIALVIIVAVTAFGLQVSALIQRGADSVAAGP